MGYWKWFLNKHKDGLFTLGLVIGAAALVVVGGLGLSVVLIDYPFLALIILIGVLIFMLSVMCWSSYESYKEDTKKS